MNAPHNLHVSAGGSTQSKGFRKPALTTATTAKIIFVEEPAGKGKTKALAEAICKLKEAGERVLVNRFDLGANKVDVNLKPTPLNGDVTVTVNFDEGSLNRAIAKVSGQAISDNSESQHVNVGTMGGGWSGAQNNAGWKSGYNLSY